MRSAALLCLLEAAVGAAAASPVILPPWPATYQMNLSTIIQPCNDSGLFNASFGSKFGIAVRTSPSPTTPDDNQTHNHLLQCAICPPLHSTRPLAGLRLVEHEESGQQHPQHPLRAAGGAPLPPTIEPTAPTVRPHNSG